MIALVCTRARERLCDIQRNLPVISTSDTRSRSTKQPADRASAAAKIYEALKAGDLKSLKIGARRLIMITALMTWLVGHEATSVTDNHRLADRCSDSACPRRGHAIAASLIGSDHSGSTASLEPLSQWRQLMRSIRRFPAWEEGMTRSVSWRAKRYSSEVC